MLANDLVKEPAKGRGNETTSALAHHSADYLRWGRPNSPRTDHAGGPRGPDCEERGRNAAGKAK